MKQSAHYWSMPLVLATGILFSLPLASVAQQRDTFFVFRQAAPNTQPQGLPLSENLSLNLDSSELERLRTANPQNMRMALPTSQGTKVFSMYKVELLHPDFRLLNQANQALPFEKGLTYQGRIAGEEGAFITCTFLKDRVLGNLALESGSYVLGSEPTGSARTHRLSRETIDENEPLDLRCGDNTLIPTGFSPPSLKIDTGIAAQAMSLSSKMINVHFDCDYALYTYLGSNETTVLNYVVSLFNVVHALYRNDGILVRIRSIRIWTTTDPYASAASTTAALYALGNEYRNGLPTGSNMVHLLSRRNLGGGIAWRSSGPGLLCVNPFLYDDIYVGPFAVSANLSTSFSSFPAYSWSVNVVTHEMGHNIGSPHTHSCDWEGGALDNCYTTEGGCAPGPAPTNGGTIMSYCHLVPGVGINFNNGFGTQPGNLIRSNVAAETCLTTTAEAQINTSTSDIALMSASGSTTLAITTSPGTLYWNISDNADWLSLSSITGQGNATLTLTYTANSGSSNRSALITLVSENASRTVTVTQSAPNAPTISSFTPTSGLSGTAVLIKGTNLSGATAVSFGGVAAASFSVVDSATITARVGSGASGAVSVTTPIGTGSKSGFTYSTSAVPTISSFSPVSAAPDQIVVLNGSNFTGVSSVTFGGVAAKSFWVNSATKITAVVGTGTSGSIVVTTPGGTATRAGFTFLPTPAPDVTSFSPLSARSNQTVTIQGTNFNGISAVTFGGVAARSFNHVSSTVVTAVVGSGASGRVAVTGSGGGDSLTGFTFISLPPPSVRSFSPTSATTGNIVQIKGMGFTGATALTFGGTAAASFSVVNDSTINATVGSGSSGSIKVTTPGGSSSRGGFSYVIMTNPPTITSFTPTSARQGQTVTITGNHFTGASSVAFGGTAAKSFSVVNATTIVAVVGSGASGNVAVGTPAGTATSSGTFTYISALPPTISSFSPTSATNGNTVVISGTNLTGASSVQFGGVAATSFTVNSATSISAIVSSGASGSVSVTTPGGTATRSGFVYAAAASPSISSFTPTTAFTGKVVTISGSGFLGATAVTFGGVNARSFTVLSNTAIVATVGSGATGSISVSSPMGMGSRTGFTFSPPPTPLITAFAPGSASTDQVVVISGSNFSGGWANVRFGGTLAKSASVLNDTTIAATVGSGSSGDVIVGTAGGADTLTGFVYIPPGLATISSFSPTSAGNGNTVLIRGTNFKGWANVSFGGTAAKSISIVDSTLIVAVVGSGASGSVRVTTGGGYAERAGFTYSSGTLQPAGYTPGEDSGQHRSDAPDRAGAGQDQRIRAQTGLELPDYVWMLLYPNPSDGVVHLQINTPEDSPNGCQLRILDALGRELKRMDRLQSGSYTVELSGSPAGLYYFVLFDSGQIPVASQRVLLR